MALTGLATPAQALIADFFFILIALASFAAALGVRAATSSSVRAWPHAMPRSSNPPVSYSVCCKRDPR